MVDYESFEFMELDNDDLRAQGLPSLDSFKDCHASPAWQCSQPSTTASQPRGQISLFKSEQQKQHNPMLIHLLPLGDEQLGAIQLPDPCADEKRRQQTNAPEGPTDFSFQEEIEQAPSLVGFDDLVDESEVVPKALAIQIRSLDLKASRSQLPNLSAADVDEAMGELELAPSMPVLPEQEVRQVFCLVSEPPTPKIRLKSESCSSNGEGIELYNEVIDDEHCDSTGAACEHSPSPASVSSASKEQRVHHDTARGILELHQEVTRDVPQAKKKPMLHEFIGYVLFLSGRDQRLSALRHAICFCDEHGNRQNSPREYFRVASFQTVSAVWKLIKCNSSKDCTKNMKRAMRMSTSNERQYFINLSQRMHRMQVFKFGDRSMECFRKLFPRDFN